ncbi:MAG: hypothetical protein HETSPECPRED_001227 [Heterodermia speciosa]|uniref:F-box domain-containing protein n=1 Tax=Heterodermia speciosa TaxID=116794 RepID=A0A8H3EWU7_9LECA|nr:MAG: hypothetical protein HETSPECPRED_001227 [Heterodermia speciosa]
MATFSKLSNMFNKLHLPSKPKFSQSSGTSMDNTTSSDQVPKEQQQQQLPAQLSRLQHLPPELLLNIASYLHPADHGCLTLTCRSLSSLPKPALTARWAHRCVAWLVSCRLERDQNPNSPTATTTKTASCYCCWCKRARPITDFTGQHRTHHLTKLLKPIWFDPDRMDEAPEQRACGFHEPATQWVEHPRCTCMGRGQKRYWIRWLDVTCMHCGEPIGHGDERDTGCEVCECEICPRLRMPCFKRYGPKRGTSWTGEIPSIRAFFRDKEGELRIVEKGAWRSFNCRDYYSPAPGEGHPGQATEAEADDEDEADPSDEQVDSDVEAPSHPQSNSH